MDEDCGDRGILYPDAAFLRVGANHDAQGPSIPRILGLRGSPGYNGHQGKMLPVRYSQNLEVISIEILMGEDKDAATIWRGPLKIGAIRQFISDIQWSELDYLIIDSPPGTGDEPLTVAQTIRDARALIVTTPQEISLADVRKSINFCRRVKMDTKNSTACATNSSTCTRFI